MAEDNLIHIIHDSFLLQGTATVMLLPIIMSAIIGIIVFIRSKPIYSKHGDKTTSAHDGHTNEDHEHHATYTADKKLYGVLGVGSVFISWVLMVIIAVYAFTTAGINGHTAAVFKYNFFGLPSAFGGVALEVGVLVDPLSIYMGLIVATLALLIHIYAVGYMVEDKGFGRFFAKFNLFTGVMLSLIFSINFIQTFVFWELVGLSSYLLIGFWYFKPSAAHAAKKAFLYNKIGDVALLSGFIILYKFTGTLTFTELPSKVAGLEAWQLALTGSLIFGGAIGKSAQFPLYTWLPDAMEGPTPVSAILHSSTMVKAGVYLIARVFFIYYIGHNGHYTFHDTTSWASFAPAFIAWIGVITAFLAALQAMTENDIKRILAYSTVSQIGYMMIGLGAGGMPVAMYHLLSHATFKALLFLTAGAVIHAVHTQDIWEMGDLRKKIPLTYWPMLIAAFALSGFPLFSGFWSKDAVLLAAFTSDIPGAQFVFWLGVLTAGITAFYTTRFIIVVFFTKPRYDEHVHPHDPGMFMVAPLWVLLVAIILESLSFIPTPWFSFEEMLYELFAPGVQPHEANYLVMSMSILVVLVGIGLSWFVYRNGEPVPLKNSFLQGVQKFITNRYYIDEVYNWITMVPVMLIGNFFQWIDKYIIDEIIINTGFAKGAYYVAIISDAFDQGFIDMIVNGFANMAKSTGQALRRIQTGITSNYATIMISTLTIFLVVINLGVTTDLLTWLY